MGKHLCPGFGHLWTPYQCLFTVCSRLKLEERDAGRRQTLPQKMLFEKCFQDLTHFYQHV